MTGFDAAGVLLASGARLEPDADIAATGFRCALEPLVGNLDVLGERGVPLVVGAGLKRSLACGSSAGQLHRMGIESRRAARAIAHESGPASGA